MARQLICSTCGTTGKPTTRTRGSFLIELFLWLMLLLPGLLYSLWRLTTKEKVCRACGSTALVPLDSPAGRDLVKRFGGAQAGSS